VKIRGTARTDERRCFQCDAQVSWRARSGEEKFARAKLVVFSIHGAAIESTEPIEPKTMVYLQASGYGAIGNASVRYCLRAGLKYRMGLLFSAPAKWADFARQKYLDQTKLQEPVHALS